MKIFVDTANIEQITRANELGVLDGVTTNPSLISKEQGQGTPEQMLKKICSIVNGPVSAEVVSTNVDGMIEEANKLIKLADNIVVKIPMIEEGLKAIKILSGRGVKINTTLVFSPSQALLAAKVGATFVSPFIGRVDDISHVGMEIIHQIKTIYDNYDFQTEILVASIRHPVHVVEAAMLGADISTMPYAVFEKLIKHPLTDIGLEKFLVDWKKVQNK